MVIVMTDTEYMQRAISLAKRGTGKVNPNPLVGAVIVKNGEIIGEGWHEQYGGLHAERNAIKNFEERVISGKNAKEDIAGATMYVTLEPCCHYGKTPPCTEAIIENGIKRVVIGSADPNPLVAGKGMEILKNSGIEVQSGILQKECDELNYVFFHFIKTKTPYVVMKYAMTLDGKIATVTGKSKWITGEKARARVHEDRNRYSAIMAGIGTVLSDNPMLTCRMENGQGRNPVRIICDTNLKTPIDSAIVQTAAQIKTIIATVSDDILIHIPYMEKGCEILTVSKKDGRIDLSELMIELGKRNIDSILLEGGSTLNFSALESGIVNRIQAYISPKLFGGEKAKTPVGGEGILEVSECFELKNKKVSLIDEDILIEGEL